MTDHLAALVKRVAELSQDGLKACHCFEEFYLRWIRPLGQRKTLTFKCPRMVDLGHDPLEGNIFVLSLRH
jgi:hypothetical protein